MNRLFSTTSRIQGFTLVELLVSISIFTLITTMAVLNHNQFNSSVVLTNLSYEIGLSIRQAQFYGISVKQASNAVTANFDSGYGIHFDLNNPKTYLLFEDVKPEGGSIDHVYDEGTDVSTEIFNIGKGNRISRICLDTIDCTKTVVDISFVRPNPDAYIKAPGSIGSTYNKAEICVSSIDSVYRKVVVESTGQISVTTDGNGICPEVAPSGGGGGDGGGGGGGYPLNEY